MREIMPMAPLGELANFTMGQSPDSARVNSDERGPPFLQGCAEFGARRPSARVHCYPPLRIAKAGSTLISVRAPVGTMNCADQDYCIGRGLAAILAKAGIADNVFLLNAIEQNISHLHRRSQGSTFLAIGSTDLNSMPVAAPELPVQRRIAEILSTVDEAIEQTEALIAKTQQIKAGLMNDLFTRGVTADGQLRPPPDEAPQLYKKSPLGWIPKEWDWAIAGRIASSIVPGRNKPILDGGQFPWITITDLQESRVSNSREALSVSAASLRNAAGRTVPAGAVIMSCVGEFGIAAIADCELVINQQLHGFVLNNRVLPGWMVHAVRMQKPFLERISTQTTIKYLNKGGCESVPISLPSPDEQEAMVDRLSSLELTIQSEKTVLQKLAATKIGLMQDLLTGRVPVAVGVPSETKGRRLD